MKVLVVNQSEAVVGGRETYLRSVVPLLRAAGFDLAFAFACRASGGSTVVGDHAGPVWTLPDDLPEIARWRPDVVYAHGLADPGVEAALADRHPTVYFPHAYFGTCVSGNKCFAVPGYRSCERVLGPACLALYLPRRCGGLNPRTMLRIYGRERRRQGTLGHYPAVVVASRHMAAEVVRNGAAPERVTLAPLFPTTATPDADTPAPRPPTDRVLFVGRITALKGWRELLAAVPAAAAELGRRLTLVVAGDGPDRAAFEAGARRSGIAAEFLGWVSADRRDAEMRAADLLAVPSVWPEPFGLVGVEAGCVGLPAVGFAVGGIPDWLTPGVSGESAPGERPDPKELAAAIVRSLAAPAHRQQLRVGAWETAKRFSPAAHVERLTAVLHRVAEGKS